MARAPERIAVAAGHEARQVGLALDHLRRRRPVRPLGLALDRLGAGPGEALAADADAVTHRLAARHHEIKEGVGRIDDDGAGRLAGPVVDDLAAQIGAQLVLRVLARGGIGWRLDLRAQRAEQGLERVERVGGSAGGDGGGGSDCDNRSGDLQIGMLDHDVPLDPSVGRSGGCRGSKPCRDLILGLG
jgi:hypothetical protein